MSKGDKMYLVKFTGVPDWGDAEGDECERQYLFSDFSKALGFLRQRTNREGWKKSPKHKVGTAEYNWERSDGKSGTYKMIGVSLDEVADGGYTEEESEA